MTDALGILHKRALSSIADSINDNDWILDTDTLYSGPDSTMVIKNGNVGIGTTNPDGVLHTIATSAASTPLIERIGTTDGPYGTIRLLAKKTSDMNDGFGPTITFRIEDDTEVITEIASLGAVRSGGNDNTGDLIFRTINTGSNSEKMRLTASGNLGIGNTTADNKLHITASSDPLKLEGLQNDATLDTVVTVDANGVLHKTAATDVPASNSAFTSVAANYTASTSDEVIFVDASSGHVTITLPTASGNTGKKYRIKKFEASANNVILDGDGAETIDGSTTQTTNVPWTGWVIISNGSNWGVIGRF